MAFGNDPAFEIDGESENKVRTPREALMWQGTNHKTKLGCSLGSASPLYEWCWDQRDANGLPLLTDANAAVCWNPTSSTAGQTLSLAF